MFKSGRFYDYSYISEFYKNYYESIDRIELLQDLQRSRASTLVAWTDRYHSMSQEISEIFRKNEKNLSEIIYPIINGKTKMTYKLAEILINEIYAVRKEGYSDLLTTLEVIKTIINFYELYPPRNRELYYLALALAAEIEDDCGVDDHLINAVDYMSRVLSDVKIYNTIKDERLLVRMCKMHYFRVLTLSHMAVIDAEKIYKAYKEAIDFFDNEDNRKIGDYDYEQLSIASNSLGLYCILNYALDKKNCDEKLINEAAIEAVKKGDSYIISGRNIRAVNPLMYLSYILGRVRLNLMTFQEGFDALYKEFSHLSKVIDYISIDSANPDTFCYTLNWAPELLYMAEYTNYSVDRIKSLRQEIARRVFEVYQSISYDRRTRQTNFYTFLAYKYVLPYYGIDKEGMQLLVKATISRENNTAIHTNMVEILSKEFIKTIIQVKPELLINQLDDDNVDDIKLNVNKYLEFVDLAAFCHDIGKIVMAEIINIQYRKITKSEFEMIKRHTDLGATATKGVSKLRDYTDIALGHQKSYDGKSGYPTDFDNRQSPFAFWIDLIHICDTLDAATDMYGRIYKRAKSFDEIMQEYIDGKGTEYNPELISILENNTSLKDTLRYLTEEGRDTMLYGIYRLI